MEFLVGRSLGNSPINIGIRDIVEDAVEELGFELGEIIEKEEDAALGNGGLGRLAACFMDSIATMKVPAADLSEQISTAAAPRRQAPAT